MHRTEKNYSVFSDSAVWVLTNLILSHGIKVGFVGNGTYAYFMGLKDILRWSNKNSFIFRCD